MEEQTPEQQAIVCTEEEWYKKGAELFWECMGKFDNGDNQGLAPVLALSLYMSKKTQEATTDKTKEIFITKTVEYCKQNLHTKDNEISLAVDLKTIIDSSEELQKIGSMSWPWKTSVRITKDRIIRRAGYGAEREYFYRNEVENADNTNQAV